MGKNEEHDAGEVETPRTVGRRQLLRTGFGLGAAATIGGVLAACGGSNGQAVTGGSTDGTQAPTTGPTENSMPSSLALGDGPIKLGFVSDFSGITSTLGQIQFNCFELAVNQINADGGIAGKQLEIIKADGGDNAEQTTEVSRKMAVEENICVVFGLISSLAREAALTVFPELKVPLFYTTYYEGAAAGAVACDPYLIGTGQVPNQQIAPMLPYLTKKFGNTFSVVGSDYIWPRGTTDVLRDLVSPYDGQVLSETYYPFGTTDFAEFFATLEKDAPDMCWVTLAGADFTEFLGQYEALENAPQLVSISMDDVFAATNPGAGVGTITSQSYFMSSPSPTNGNFLKAYQEVHGADAVVNSIGEAAYTSVHLFKGAVESAGGSIEPGDWIPKLPEQRFDAPSGPMGMDGDTQHLISTTFVGQLKEDGKIEILEEHFGIEPEVLDCRLADS